jgi:hypothetical protein
LVVNRVSSCLFFFLSAFHCCYIFFSYILSINKISLLCGFHWRKEGRIRGVESRLKDKDRVKTGWHYG